MIEAHIYPVGALRQLTHIKRALNPKAQVPIALKGWRRNTITYAIRTIWADKGRRSSWNGYLAEPTNDSIYWTRCGHGWTKRRAMSSLVRHVGEVQRDGYLTYLPESAR